jgi:N,N-dimethylformamidase beta subunit-like, C-terminal/Domain of unknown function (DUF4082)/Bacterial Ig-like domain/Bacterial Ig domain
LSRVNFIAWFVLAGSLVFFGLQAQAAPRANERQPALDYHQPRVLPGSNQVAAGAVTTACTNPVACENALSGNPPSEWRLLEPGDAGVQGFATDQSVNAGGSVRFKIKATASYHIDIYRAGWYQGNGARKVASLGNIAVQNQPACIVDTTNTTGLIDCGNWSVSASWTVPASAVSGIYFARLTRNDTGGASYAFFTVRNDASRSAVIYQASDTQRAAYNNYGGNSLYQCTVNCPPGNPQLYKGAFKVSFNRPNVAASQGMQYSFFGAEFEMVEFLEANGYDVSYISAVDTDRSGALVKNHRIFISSGHDEYWSGTQRANVEAARDAGVNLAFFSGNEVFWKTRYEASIDGSNTNYRTLVSYKETHFDAVVDPLDPPIWTGTWRDARFSPPADGGRPENGLTGNIYTVDPPASFAIQVPAADGKMRFWRNTSVATQTAGQTATLAPNTLGYEWDEDLDNGARPSGIVRMSTTTQTVPSHLIDPSIGNHYATGVATHHLTLHRAASGALIFGAGTVQWSWGLEGSPDGTAGADVRMQQATVNLLADMGVQPTTLIPGLIAASASTDSTPPTSNITSPVSGSSVAADTLLNIVGSASDSGGVVGGVEVSTDGGVSWHPVSSGRENWIYQWQPLQPGSYSLLSRAVDDSANLGATSTAVSVTVTPRQCPCSIWPPNATPVSTGDSDPNAIEIGVKFVSDTNGTISGIRFYKSGTNTGTHVGSLWTANGQLLAQATFVNETTSGWQQVNFASPVIITAGTHYVASYHTNVGHYAGDNYYFFNSGFDNPPLHALKNGVDGGNGVYVYSASSAFPSNTFKSSNYWVDVVFSGTGSGGDTTPPSVVSRSPTANATGVAVSANVTATFSEAVQASTIVFTLKNAANNSLVSSTVSYNSTNFTATLTPGTLLSPSTTYTATLSGAKDAAGNTMSSISWSFTTASAQANCPCTLWPASATPSVAADSDTNSIEVGVKFRTDVNGFITGIRFYKGSTNTGTHVGSLWSAGGSLLAQATFSNESTSGWQQVSFASPVAVTAGATYVASYHANAGHYAGDTGYFAASGVDSGPLHALKDGLSGANGVYSYSTTSVMPTNGYQSSNYWVDVVFTTSTSSSLTIWPSTAAPTVAADADTKSIEVGVKFRSDVSGRVTGIRFYKSSTNSGPHVGSLWNSNGTLLAQATFVNETASGWQQVNFASPIAISAGTTYVASYHASSGHYADDTGYFANSGVDNGPLHALRDGVSGANGVYTYSTSSVMPTNGYQSSNYWVDIVFSSP